jgi:hypothetical protein
MGAEIPHFFDEKRDENEDHVMALSHRARMRRQKSHFKGAGPAERCRRYKVKTVRSDSTKLELVNF